MNHHQEKLVVLIETTDPIEAEVIKSKLEAFGLSCWLEGLSGIMDFDGLISGPLPIKVLVREECLELARQAIRPGETDTPEEKE